MSSYIDVFRPYLNAEIVEDILSWDHDKELSKLVDKLNSIRNPQQFLDHYAEALIAKYLLKKGCVLKVEVPTQNNKRADFLVSISNHIFFAHIKRLNEASSISKKQNILSQFKHLENIKRAYSVRIEIWPDLTDSETKKAIKECKSFILNSSPNDFKMLFDEEGHEIGICHIMSKNNGENVSISEPVIMGHPNTQSRLYDKISDAYKQFMPNNLNVIFVTSFWSSDIDDFKNALFSNNGFWTYGKHEDSNVAIWFNFELKRDLIKTFLFVREEYIMPSFLKMLFNI